MPPRGGSRLLLISGGAALALAVPPLLLRSVPANWNGVEAAVAGMSPAERDRLDRNTREYLALSEPDRQKYRDLHAALEADATGGAGRMGQTMQDYCEWLASNQSYDRQRLRTTTDSQARIDEMQRIVDKRNEDFRRSRRRWSSLWLRRGVPDISADELATLMSALESRLPYLNEDEQSRLIDAEGSEKAGVARYFAVFSILRSRNENIFKMLQNVDPDDLLAALPQVEMPPSYAEAQVEGKRFVVFAMIVGNVLQEYESVFKGHTPTTADLERMVAEWPDDKRDELERILEKEPAEFRSELEQDYARGAIAMDIRDLWAMAPPEFFMGMFGRGHGPRPDGDQRRDRMFPDGPRGEGDPDHRGPPRPEDRPGLPPDVGPAAGAGRGPGDRGPFPRPFGGPGPQNRPGEGPPPQRPPRNDVPSPGS